jgi:hypothetical protein
MTEPLIHIGYHKSGTTWLQQEVFCQRSLGFCAPWGRQSHLAIDRFVIVNPFQFNAGEARRQFMAGLRQAADDNLVPVITSADLCGHPPNRSRTCDFREHRDLLHEGGSPTD